MILKSELFCKKTRKQHKHKQYTHAHKTMAVILEDTADRFDWFFHVSVDNHNRPLLIAFKWGIWNKIDEYLPFFYT